MAFLEENLIIKNIVDELVNFYIVRNTTEVTTTLTFESTGAKMQLKGNLNTSQEEVQQLGNWLSERRDPSLENYYLELLGNSHHEISDYQIIGLMVDDVSLVYENNLLTIILYRKK